MNASNTTFQTAKMPRLPFQLRVRIEVINEFGEVVGSNGHEKHPKDTNFFPLSTAVLIGSHETPDAALKALNAIYRMLLAATALFNRETI